MTTKLPTSQHNIELKCCKCGNKIDLIKEDGWLDGCKECHNKLFRIAK